MSKKFHTHPITVGADPKEHGDIHPKIGFLPCFVDHHNSDKNGRNDHGDTKHLQLQTPANILN